MEPLGVFDRELGQRILWMVRHPTHEVKLQLDPPELGKLEVRISVHHEQVSVAFHVHHALRETLETALPKLRMMLSDEGLTLVNVDVSEHSQEGPPDQGWGKAADVLSPAWPAADETPASQGQWVSRSSLVDAYV